MHKDILLLFVLLKGCVCLFQTGCFYKVPS